MLWNRSLVMIDRETESLWSQLLGTAQRGPLKGTELEILPAIMTDWKTWRELHPDTTAVILSRTSKNYRRQFYRNPARFVVGIAASGHARAWPLDQLLKTPVVNDSLDGTPLVVAFDGASRTAFLYTRRLECHELHLKERGKTMVDRESCQHESLNEPPPETDAVVSGTTCRTRGDGAPGRIWGRSANVLHRGCGGDVRLQIDHQRGGSLGNGHRERY